MVEFGKIVLFVGIFLVFVGVLMIFMPQLPYLGKLPGDICVKKENFSFYFPVTTSIVLSILLTIILNLTKRI